MHAQVSAEVDQGSAYGQKFSGVASLVYAGHKISTRSALLKAYSGTLSVLGQIDFSKAKPAFTVSADATDLNVKDVLAGSPAAAGTFTGRTEVAGTFDKFSGKFKGSFRNASVMGQPLEEGAVDFKYDDHEFLIDFAEPDLRPNGIVRQRFVVQRPHFFTLRQRFRDNPFRGGGAGEDARKGRFFPRSAHFQSGG